jgi:hypothetical protein
MPGYDGTYAGRRVPVWTRGHLVDIVHHIQSQRSDIDDRSERKAGRPSGLVIVSPYRNDWSKRMQRFQNTAVANIAGMNDQIASGQRCNGLRPQQAMRV